MVLLMYPHFWSLRHKVPRLLGSGSSGLALLASHIFSSSIAFLANLILVSREYAFFVFELRPVIRFRDPPVRFVGICHYANAWTPSLTWPSYIANDWWVVSDLPAQPQLDHEAKVLACSGLSHVRISLMTSWDRWTTKYDLISLLFIHLNTIINWIVQECLLRSQIYCHDEWHISIWVSLIATHRHAQLSFPS